MPDPCALCTGGSAAPLDAPAIDRRTRRVIGRGTVVCASCRGACLPIPGWGSITERDLDALDREADQLESWGQSREAAKLRGAAAVLREELARREARDRRVERDRADEAVLDRETEGR